MLSIPVQADTAGGKHTEIQRLVGRPHPTTEARADQSRPATTAPPSSGLSTTCQRAGALQAGR